MNAGSEELERLLAILSDIYEPSGEHFSAKNAISALFAEREAQVAALHAAMLTTCTECGGMGHHAYMSADGPSMYGCHRCGGAGRYPICEQVQQAVLDSATVAREHDARVRAEAIRECVNSCDEMIVHWDALLLQYEANVTDERHDLIARQERDFWRGASLRIAKLAEPERWCCEGCGEEFDHDQGGSHGRAEHHPDCYPPECGSKCPVQVQCGPVSRLSEPGGGAQEGLMQRALVAEDERDALKADVARLRAKLREALDWIDDDTVMASETVMLLAATAPPETPE